MNKTFIVLLQQEDNWFIAKCLENSVVSQGIQSKENHHIEII